MKLFLPFRGEFGFVIMYHAPQVHAAIRPGDLVCCERGNEALYPGAERYVLVDRPVDAERRNGQEPELTARLRKRYGGEYEVVAPDVKAPRKYFVPQPHHRFGIKADIVVCPRKREYGPDKNWLHWQELTNRIVEDGMTPFAAGAPDSSFPVSCECSWDYDRFLDATIEAMLSAKIVIATDAGLAHLAVLCGRPLLMISHGPGLVAFGKDDRGKPYWPIHMDRFRAENHLNAPIRVVQNAWFSAEKVYFAATEFLGDLTQSAAWVTLPACGESSALRPQRETAGRAGSPAG